MNYENSTVSYSKICLIVILKADKINILLFYIHSKFWFFSSRLLVNVMFETKLSSDKHMTK